MADLYKKFRGVIGDIFHVGGAEGPQVKNNSGVVEIRDSDDSAMALGRAALIPATGETVNDIINLLSLRGRIADVVFSFAGASIPAAGENSDAFGFCHTAGGSYSAGDIVYSSGTAYTKIPASVATTITTRSGVTGTISLNANGVYVREGASWVLKGDGGADVGPVKCIKMTYDKDDTTVTSSTSVPDGASVVRVVNSVTTPFNGTSPTLAAIVDGTSDMSIFATADSDLENAAQYENDEIQDVTATTEGSVKITISAGGSTSGVGLLYVFYVIAGS